MPQPSQAEKNTFGEDVKLHPITMMPLEQGRGALPADQQALLHIREVELGGDKKRADEFRKKMGIPTAEEIAEKQAAEAAEAAAEKAKMMDVAALHERIAELEAQIATLTKKEA